ncbi:MAG: hypothetical protein OXF01_02080 [Gemmatimonadetes bacterium]|nr:hypothetical protein [Gemmatimonadota bacterium]
MPLSFDGFYPEGAEVCVRAEARPPATFLGWNEGVSGRDPEATVVMDDGQLAEAAFALDAAELQSGVPAQVSLQLPPGASAFEVRFDARAASRGAAVGLWIADQDLWPGWVRSIETADRVLRDGDAARVRIGQPSSAFPRLAAPG